MVVSDLFFDLDSDVSDLRRVVFPTPRFSSTPGFHTPPPSPAWARCCTSTTYIPPGAT